MINTAREKIRTRLALADEALPLHALKIPGVSESAAGARLREMTRNGETLCITVPGKKFKVWTLKPVSDY